MEEFINVEEKAISVAEAIITRHSVREFSQKAIEQSVWDELLNLSKRAPSWKNSQPWKLRILQGKSKNKMAESLVNAAKAGPPSPENPWPENYPADAKRRMFDLGMKIYGVAGIDRKDKAARDQFMLNNFKFFDAPAAIFITTTFDLNFYVGIDIGCFLQTILLSARALGLGTCPQAALGAFPDVVRKELELQPEEKVICGLSIGYPKEESQLNRYHTPREPLENMVQFYN
ncbi:nitroreductase [Leptospira sp. GIMC2001]|uniref:nitroreductase n=1 Tax=Leptospira sp. GIMC2001 TaxID=1513297 RepID=UPI00234B02D7|nr:nitroreductase [Leptospira sp. GIMC2001]WCL47599.1 nitroreductase [Leptospira sp. GIMC2001]